MLDLVELADKFAKDPDVYQCFWCGTPIRTPKDQDSSVCCSKCGRTVHPIMRTPMSVLAKAFTREGTAVAISYTSSEGVKSFAAVTCPCPYEGHSCSTCPKLEIKETPPPTREPDFIMLTCGDSFCIVAPGGITTAGDSFLWLDLPHAEQELVLGATAQNGLFVSTLLSDSRPIPITVSLIDPSLGRAISKLHTDKESYDEE